MVMKKPSVLIIAGRYLPGYKGGGPIRTLANMVDRLCDEFHFKVITQDRDSGDNEPYRGITVDSWQPVGKADVCYLSPQSLSLRALRRVILATQYDILYLNSFFSPAFTIKPLILRRLGLLRPAPLVVAPRGEFSPGALALKIIKKRIYLATAKLIGLYRGVIWQASSKYEEEDIRRWFGDHVPVIVAPDVPPQLRILEDSIPQREKAVGRLKALFLSRISRKKNLDGTLLMLKWLKGEVHFNIYGPVDEPDYWAQCQRIISSLPGNINVQYRGALPNEQVNAVIREHDLFLLPTLGENFGHVILEALVAGCPVLISNRTPWRNLEDKGIGWDLPLEEPERYQAVIQQCVEMDAQTHRAWSQRAREYGLKYIQSKSVLEKNRVLFRHAILKGKS